jgi:hypothetical protein
MTKGHHQVQVLNDRKERFERPERVVLANLLEFHLGQGE